ncbi:hypothetical protein GGR56DRAFT_398197 [Xylariaceae sp. FL0804]|nr:hypothetical protein GGR56DRAFT_398197 [Xylariaceae sp. FL0804]
MSNGGGSANVSPASPVWWFSSDVEGSQGPQGWRLDVVTLLAVIGESSIAEHAQTITASVLCLLPRIIPAPQALLKPSRPARLPDTNARMTGVYSGVVLDSVGFFANIIHPLEELPALSFRVLKIEHRKGENVGGAEVCKSQGAKPTLMSRLSSTLLLGGKDAGDQPWTRHVRPKDVFDHSRLATPAKSTGFNRKGDIEAGTPFQGISRRSTVKEKVQDKLAHPTLNSSTERPAIPANLLSPIHILEVFSVLLTGAIIAFAAAYNDGTAILAVTLMALASSVVGWASWWKPMLMNRLHTSQVPAGDVIIRTREGAFLLIHCTEEVARELYSGTEECKYHINGRSYRAFMGLGTLLLMVSVILLGNCKWKTQIFIAASYITLNALYWTLGLLPKRYFWDLSRYECTELTTPREAEAHVDKTKKEEAEAHVVKPKKKKDKNKDQVQDQVQFQVQNPEDVPSFTRTLWYAIWETKRTAWVERSGAAPSTPQWKMWLAEAERAAKAGHEDWHAVERKDAIMKLGEDGSASPTTVSVGIGIGIGGAVPGGPTSSSDHFQSPGVAAARDFDAAEQAVPAVEIPANRRESHGGAF